MAQKNFVRRNFTNRVNEVIGFNYPKLHEGKTVYVDFFAFDPSIGRMRRKKKHFDHIKNKGQRSRAINHYMVVVSECLDDFKSLPKGIYIIVSGNERYKISI